MWIKKWSGQQEAILRRMWTDGASASIIGDELGFSRNAIMGKVHRLRLEARSPTFKHSSKAVTGRPRHVFDGKPLKRIITVKLRKDGHTNLTKGELRRLFEEAWRNTATMEKQNETV
jgi:hypothetical protein